MSHAGIGLLRHLADKTGLTRGQPTALDTGRLVHHDQSRVLADVACAIADGARGFSDFRVLAHQSELSGQVASVPAVHRMLEEIARGGERTAGKLTATVNTARAVHLVAGRRRRVRRSDHFPDISPFIRSSLNVLNEYHNE